MTNRQRIPKLTALAVFAAAVVIIAAVMYTQLAGGRIPLLSAEPYHVSVLVDEPLQLVGGSDVREAGIKVGSVSDIQPRGQRALVTMTLKPGHQTVFRDARVSTRLRTLLGESYLALDPGTAAAGRVERGGMLPPHAATETVPLDKILNTLDAPTRRQLGPTLRAFGASVDERGADVNAIVGGLSDAVVQGTPATQVLSQERRPLSQLIDQGGRVLAAVGRRGDQLQHLIRSINTTSRAVASRDDALRATIDELPSTLTQVRGSLGRVTTLARKTTPVSNDLARAAGALQPVIVNLQPTAADARRLVRSLPSALRAADPMLQALRPAVTKAAPVADALGPVLRNLVPVLEYLDPYKRDLWGVAAGMGSVFEFIGGKEGPGYDATGGEHDRVAYGRVQLMANPASLGATPPGLKKLEDALLQTGVLQVLGGLKTNYYPAPGTADSPNHSDGSYTRVEAIPPSGR